VRDSGEEGVMAGRGDEVDWWGLGERGGRRWEGKVEEGRDSMNSGLRRKGVSSRPFPLPFNRSTTSSAQI